MNEENIKEAINAAKRPKTKNYVIILVGFVILLGLIMLFTGVGGENVLGLSGEAPPALPGTGSDLAAGAAEQQSSPPSDLPQLPGF